MVDELIKLGVDPKELIQSIGLVVPDTETNESLLLSSFSQELDRGQINLELLNHAITYSETKDALVLRILSLIQLADF